MNTWKTLQHVTRALSMTPDARNILLFGSTARSTRDLVFDGLQPDEETYVYGNDFDLVVTVPTSVYMAWNLGVAEILNNGHVDCEDECGTDGCEVDFYRDRKAERFYLALDLLGAGNHATMAPMYIALTSLNELTTLDIHLMPENWLDIIEAVQHDLPHKDAQFVANIARDAILLTAGSTKDFGRWMDSIVDPIRETTSRAHNTIELELGKRAVAALTTVS
jgi:hypothetical protein